jgi:phospholipid/cholesterol/gamma-HCH transport system ATP-binding protein
MDPVAPAPEIPVELREVRKSFEDKPVLRGVSLALGKGTTLAVMGGSGAGKTVLLRITDGLIRPEAGQVSLFGTRIERMREEAMLPLRRRAGFVFQGAALFDSLSVFENVAFPLREHTSMSLGEITDRVHRFLALVGLPGVDARALVLEPEVVFFDEPTAGLDPTNARLVGELMVSLRSGVCDTAIVVTHDIEFANMIADQMAILHQGRIADIGTPAEMRASSNPDVRRFLAGELRED